MAMAVRRVDAPPRRVVTGSPRRVSAPRTRVAAGAEPAKQAEPVGAPSPRPDLRVVPKRRTAAIAALVIVVVVVALMLAAVVLHTRLAERQLEIDHLEQEVTQARERFYVLRQQRAELRSPTRPLITVTGRPRRFASERIRGQ